MPYTAAALGFMETINNKYVRSRDKVKAYSLMKSPGLRHIEHLQDRQEDPLSSHKINYNEEFKRKCLG